MFKVNKDKNDKVLFGIKARVSHTVELLRKGLNGKLCELYHEKLTQKYTTEHHKTQYLLHTCDRKVH